MSRRLMVLAMLLGLLIGSPSTPRTAGAPPAGDPATRWTRTAERGGITVKAAYAVPEYFRATGNTASATRFRPGANIVILLTLDTHGGDLQAFDPLKGTVLRNNRGEQVTPFRWEVTTEGSHHREGVLLFSKVHRSGKNLVSGARFLELVVRGLGGVPERVLRWDLPVR